MTSKTKLKTKMLVFVAVMLLPLLGTSSARGNNDRAIEVTFTKWLINTSGLTPPQFGPLLEGFTAGAAPGGFDGTVIQSVAQRLANGEDIKRLEARYTVTANNPRRSFSALIHGQQSASLHGVLKGVITDGWHIGAEVQVEFQGSPCSQGSGTCFDGTIRILSDED